MKLKILMIDDHPSMIEGYKIILSYNDFGYEIETTSATDSKSAYEIITKTKKSNAFNVVFLDYSLPAYGAKNIQNGKDLALVIKKRMPKAKIVILTSHTESILLYDIIRNVEPAGVLVKSDFSAEELLSAFQEIMEGKIYHSQTVKQTIKELTSKKIYLDSFNRQIISLIAQGINTKSIPNHINMSISAIEKRKVTIREYFLIPKGNDEDIIREAKRLGLI